MENIIITENSIRNLITEALYNICEASSVMGLTRANREAWNAFRQMEAIPDSDLSTALVDWLNARLSTLKAETEQAFANPSDRLGILAACEREHAVCAMLDAVNGVLHPVEPAFDDLD